MSTFTEMFYDMEGLSTETFSDIETDDLVISDIFNKDIDEVTGDEKNEVSSLLIFLRAVRKKLCLISIFSG